MISIQGKFSLMQVFCELAVTETISNNTVDKIWNYKKRERIQNSLEGNRSEIRNICKHVEYDFEEQSRYNYKSSDLRPSRKRHWFVKQYSVDSVLYKWFNKKTDYYGYNKKIHWFLKFRNNRVLMHSVVSAWNVMV